MEVGYLVFIYEPFAKYEDVVKTPLYTSSVSALQVHIEQVRRRRGLFYIDVFALGSSMHSLKFDNELTDRELAEMMDKLRSVK